MTFEEFRDATVFFVVHVEYGVISEVCHDQTIIFKVHVDYGVFSEVFFYQTILFVFLAN